MIFALRYIKIVRLAVPSRIIGSFALFFARCQCHQLKL